jgi:hypothetical protein
MHKNGAKGILIRDPFLISMNSRAESDAICRTTTILKPANMAMAVHSLTSPKPSISFREKGSRIKNTAKAHS